MTTKKIYGPWIKWHGGECPVPLDTKVEVKLRNGKVLEPAYAFCYKWAHFYQGGDIVEYRTITEQPDLEAAEKLLRENGYTITPPAKPLTAEPEPAARVHHHPAEFTVHTPTGPVHSCVKHARQIEGFMRMLGAHTHAVKAPDGAECANCINEAKAKGETS